MSWSRRGTAIGTSANVMTITGAGHRSVTAGSLKQTFRQALWTAWTKTPRSEKRRPKPRAARGPPRPPRPGCRPAHGPALRPARRARARRLRRRLGALDRLGAIARSTRLRSVIFKRVGDGRPYPDHGLGSKEWASVPPRQVRLERAGHDQGHARSWRRCSTRTRPSSATCSPTSSCGAASSTSRTGCTARCARRCQQRSVLHARVLRVED